VHSLANGPEVQSLSPSPSRSVYVFELSQVYLCILVFMLMKPSLKTHLPSCLKVTKPLLETSRRGYLAAISASSYSYVSLLQHFLPIMNPGSAYLLRYADTYISHARVNSAIAAFYLFFLKFCQAHKSL
jgi:hypothetical protein